MTARVKRKHILQYTKKELKDLGWDGQTYFSRSQGGRSAPFIQHYDSDSDYEYDDLSDVPEHLLPSTWQGDAGASSCTDDLGLAASLKLKGNAAFKSRNFADAVKCYDQCLSHWTSIGSMPSGSALAQEVAKVHSNKAECFVRMKEWHEAVNSANMAISLDATNWKALWRRAKSWYMLGRFKMSIQDVSDLLAKQPKNGAAEKLYDKIQRMLSIVARDKLIVAPTDTMHVGAQHLGFKHAFQYMSWIELMKMRIVCPAWRFLLRVPIADLHREEASAEAIDHEWKPLTGAVVSGGRAVAVSPTVGGMTCIRF
jgi:tetratricopeptide (TPR) repeat protein